MAMQWTDRVPQRPDRYLDWDLVNRVAAGSTADGWCSVLVQLKAAAGADPAANLWQLREALPTGSSTTTVTINATRDEVALLNKRIAELRGGTLTPNGDDDPALAFFVYMPESVAYANGGFADTSYYKIRLVGPPIPGLRFDQRPAMVMALQHMAADTSTEVAIGIIDTAIGFANERFRTRSGGAAGDVDGSRVEQLWIQTVEEADDDPDQTVLFGRRLEQSDIEKALEESAETSGVINENSVYAATGAVDFETALRQATARRGGHGTHVMDLACGYAPDDAAGKQRPILAVQLPEPAKLGTSGVTTASYVLQGLRQILLWADKIRAQPLPLVVNFSYGYFAGPKDGTHVLELELKRLIESRKAATALVLPAGNTYLARVTAQMSLAPGQQNAVDWVVLPDCGTSSFLEIWLDAASTSAPISVELSIPGAGVLSMAVPANGKAKVLEDDGKPIGALYFDAKTGNPARSRLFLAVNPTKTFKSGLAAAPSGAWGVKLVNTSSTAIAAHLYIQREDTPAGDEPPGRQSYFEHCDAFGWDAETGNYDKLTASCPITHLETLTAIASMPEAVVVAAALAGKDGASPKPALYTASGPAPLRAAPDFAAIADDDRALPGVIAAGTRSGSYVTFYGTSVAAPQLARRLADAGADLARLKTELGVAQGAARDPRLGWAVVPASRRPDIPPRRKS